MTPKQQRFVAEYLIDLDASAAARRAGYSAKTAQQIGYQLLQDPSVAAAVTAGKTQQLATAELTAARVLEELRRIAFADLRDFFDADGNLKPLHQLTEAQAAVLVGFDVVKKNMTAGDGVVDTVHKPKFAEKVKALELLAKHFKLLTERIEVKGDAAAARVARLVAARKRVDGQ